MSDEYEGAMMPADMRPCPYCGEPIRAVAIVCRFCRIDLRGQPPQAPAQPQPQHPQPVEPPRPDVVRAQAAPTQSQQNIRIAIVLGSLAVLFAVAIVVYRATRGDDVQRARHDADPVAPSQPEPTQRIERAPEVPASVAHARAIMNAPNLNAVLKLVKLGDMQVGDDFDPGVVQLGAWAMQHLKWGDVVPVIVPPPWEEIRKNPDRARGKLACWSGSIIEIRESVSNDVPIQEGGIMTAGAKVVRFMGFFDSTGVVQGSTARFCGVITGLQSYENSAGGSTHSVFTLGMFDTPKNRSER